MLRFRNWEKWQARGLKDVRRMRQTRESSLEKPYAMGWICVAATFDDHFHAFAIVIPRAKRAGAESFLIRALQYAALHSAFEGKVSVEREMFGQIVLTREYDVVSERLGALIYDALVSSGIAYEFGTRSEQVSNVFVPALLSVAGVAKPPVAVVAGQGGSSAPPSTSNGDGSGQVVSPQDRAVFELLWRKIGESSGYRGELYDRARALRESLATPNPDGDGIRALVDELTPRWPDEIRVVRMNFAMAEKARNAS